MPYKVLIVDDSNFFQTRLKEIISECPELTVVGVANNGREAIDLVKKLNPDIVSMDYEMPLMDGVSAVRVIMEEKPTPVVMLSSMTFEGARTTLDALEAGAVDFLNKNFAEVSGNSDAFKKNLYKKLITYAQSKPQSETSEPVSDIPPQVDTRSASSVKKERHEKTAVAVTEVKVAPASKVNENNIRKSYVKRNSALALSDVKAVVIGASTGGPVAVAKIIAALPATFPAPVVIIQHMPENFTKAFAERLNRYSALNVKEAAHGDVLNPGNVFVAPGGKQCMFDQNGRTLKVISGDERVNYCPSVDISFASAANVFKKHVLGIVLTGMGADGCDGARLIKQQGGYIWNQDKASCVVYGMPAAVAKSGFTDAELPIEELASALASIH